MPEFGEDIESVLPGRAGSPGVAVGVVSIAQVGQDLGFVVTIAEVAAQVEGALIASLPAADRRALAALLKKLLLAIEAEHRKGDHE